VAEIKASERQERITALERAQDDLRLALGALGVDEPAREAARRPQEASGAKITRLQLSARTPRGPEQCIAPRRRRELPSGSRAPGQPPETGIAGDLAGAAAELVAQAARA
jgi:hypothetical protein